MMMLKSVLRRLAGGESGAASPVAFGGAMGLALARVAQETINLPLVVQSVVRGSDERAQFVEGLDAPAQLVRMRLPGAVSGLPAIEPQLRCAVVDSRTLGAPRAGPVAPAAVTGTESAMMAPLLHKLLGRLVSLGMLGLPPMRDLRLGRRLPDAKAASVRDALRTAVFRGGDRPRGAVA